MERKIASINLKLNKKKYRIISIVRGKDRSLYFIHPKNYFSKEINQNVSPMKCSYHTSGQEHFKFGLNNKKFLWGKKDKISEIKKSTGVMYFSLYDVNTINSNRTMIDPAREKSGYKNFITINASKYKHLTLRVYLKNKKYKGTPSDPFGKLYKILLGDIDVIITLEDKWLGKKQNKKLSKPTTL